MKFRDLPLRKKLMRIIFMASGVAMLVTILFIFLYDWTTYRPELVRLVRSVADLYNSTLHAPLNFNDPKAATENLSSLKSQNAVSMACAYDSKGDPFASYVRSSSRDEKCPENLDTTQEYVFTRDHLYFYRPIRYQNAIIGYLMIRYDVPLLYIRLLRYGFLTIAVLLSLVLASLVLVTQLERYISRPVLNLARIAELVSQNKQYELRANKNSNDEVGDLTLAFNHLLETVESSLHAMSESESRFRQVSESNMLGIIFCHNDGSVSEANNYFLNLIGYTRQDLNEGKINWKELTPAEYTDLDNNAMTELSLNGRYSVYEKEYIRKDGERVPILLGGAYLEHSMTDMVAFILDITDAKKIARERDQLLIQERHARQEAEKALQIREDFISIAAHELRTPLTPLKLQLDLIKRKLSLYATDIPNYEKLEKIINSSEQQVTRFSRLIEDMLDVSRIRTGKFSLDKEEVDLSQLALDIVHRYQSEIIKTHTSYTLDIEESTYCYVDRLRIEQVIINLLTNALKYGGGKPFHISVKKQNEAAVFLIQDEGIGISEEDQKRVFNRFERAVSLKHFGGFGLGLYITRQIVEAHGGTIKLVSSLGKGSTFMVTLPVTEQKEV